MGEILRTDRERRIRWNMESKESETMYKLAKGGELATREVLGLKPQTPDENGERKVVTDQTSILHIASERWRKIYNRFEDETPEEVKERDRARERVKEVVKKHMEGREVEEAMEGLAWSSIFAKSNIEKALKEVKKGTVPGGQGFDTGFYNAQKDVMLDHLSQLFWSIAESGDMTEAMKEATISVLYKGKGKDTEEITSYRPVSITDTTYRILTKAIKLKLEAAVTAAIGRLGVWHTS